MATSATIAAMAYEPDPATAKLFARHKQAAQTIKETREPVLEAAEQAIRQGATNPELAKLTGMSGETFRKLAEKLGVDNRVKLPTVGPEAAARLGKRVAAEPTGPQKAPPTAPTRHQLLDRLTARQVAAATSRVWGRADRQQHEALTEASNLGDRAVVETALRLGLISEDEIRAL
jgi:nucleotide-binding universal stress UspA family protein